jgi:hypothetical protein
MDAYALVRSRDGHRCQRCGCSVLNVPSSKHHRKLRSQGGLDTADNLLSLCGSGTTGCHGWAHANPAQARSYGLIVWRIRNPAEVPVRTFNGWVLLDAMGDRTPLSDREAIAHWERLDNPPGAA